MVTTESSCTKQTGFKIKLIMDKYKMLIFEVTGDEI